MDGKKKFFVITAVLLSLSAGILYHHIFPVEPSTLIKKAVSRNISSYYLLIETGTFANGSELQYSIKAWHLAPHYYRVEILPHSFSWEEDSPEQIFIFDGKSTHIFNPKLKDYYRVAAPLQKEGLPFLLCNFMESLDRARETEFQGEEIKNNEKLYMFKVIPEHTTYNHARQDIWLEKRTLLPRKIIVYDRFDQPRQEVVFKDIAVNQEISEKLFQVDTTEGF